MNLLASSKKKKRHIKETRRHLKFERGEGTSTRQKFARGCGDKGGVAHRKSPVENTTL